VPEWNVADILANLRHGDARDAELELLADLGRREANEVQPILIRDKAKHGRAIPQARFASRKSETLRMMPRALSDMTQR
jgi:hypothetical protein